MEKERKASLLCYLVICLNFCYVSTLPKSNGSGQLENGSLSSHHGSLERSSGDSRSLFLKSFFVAPIGLLLLAVIIFTLIPTAVVTTGRRTMQREMSFLSRNGLVTDNSESLISRAALIAKRVLESEQCVEKISCELSRMSKSFSPLTWIMGAVQALLPRTEVKARFLRGLEGHCQKYYCHPVKVLTASIEERKLKSY